MRLPDFFRFGWFRGPRSPVAPEVLAAVADPLTTSLFPVRAETRLAKAFIAGSRSRIAAKKGVATKIEEYVPTVRPINKARERSLSGHDPSTPVPINKIEPTGRSATIEVLIERIRV